MWQDFLMLVVWWGVWLVFGGIGYLYSARIFDGWSGKGYAFGKILGVIMVSFVAWLLGMGRLMPFGVESILVSSVMVFAIGWKFFRREKRATGINLRTLAVNELWFFFLLSVWAFVKGHEPNISGLEKFMDFGFIKSILQSRYFPPEDMWYAGKSINYYYFGHLYSAVVTKISGINPIYSFNLMLATLFALTGTMTTEIVNKLLEKFHPGLRYFGMLVAVYIMLLGGNLHTIYSYTKGYIGDYPPAFWTIFGKAEEMYWYPNATRFIPFTIHEFPAYSFVVSDIHGHVLGIPIALLAIGLLMVMFSDNGKLLLRTMGLYGFVVGCAFMTNALDGLIYIGLFLMLQTVRNIQFSITYFQSIFKRQHENSKRWVIEILTTLMIFVITVLPFVMTFKSFVNGIAINCPPKFLENRRIGMFVFEEVEKCQRSPLWMLLILWGLFVFGAVWLLINKRGRNLLEQGLLWVSVFCLGLIIFAELFYFRDIYPLHFRSNTMFKLGYQVFILMTFVSVYAFVKGLNNWKKQGLLILAFLPLLYLTAIYPYFSIKGYFGKLGFTNYKGLNGVEWIRVRYPDNYALINWILKNVRPIDKPVVLEANGDSYTDFNMVSTFTGLPTVAGWTVHEWLWREGYDPIAKRADEVRNFYESGDMYTAKEFIEKYRVAYVVVGDFEREKYPYLNLEKIELLADRVFVSNQTSLYKIR